MLLFEKMPLDQIAINWLLKDANHAEECCCFINLWSQNGGWVVDDFGDIVLTLGYVCMMSDWSHNELGSASISKSCLVLIECVTKNDVKLVGKRWVWAHCARLCCVGLFCLVLCGLLLVCEVLFGDIHVRWVQFQSVCWCGERFGEQEWEIPPFSFSCISAK